MCNHDCFNCIYDDCINDTLDIADYEAIKERDKESTGKRKAPNGFYRRTMTESEYYKMYYEAHKEELSLKAKERYQKNKDRYYAQIKKYRANRTPEQIARDAANKKRWLQEHRRKLKEERLKCLKSAM